MCWLICSAPANPVFMDEHCVIKITFLVIVLSIVAWASFNGWQQVMAKPWRAIFLLLFLIWWPRSMICERWMDEYCWNHLWLIICWSARHYLSWVNTSLTAASISLLVFIAAFFSLKSFYCEAYMQKEYKILWGEENASFQMNDNKRQTLQGREKKPKAYKSSHSSFLVVCFVVFPSL